MQLTIVYPDNLVVIDRVCQNFPLDPFNPPDNFHALQWSGDDGRIEYNDYTVAPINELPVWASDIVDEFNRLRADDQEKLKQQRLSAFYVENGQARKTRIKQQAEADTKAQFHLMQQQIADLQSDVENLLRP